VRSVCTFLPCPEPQRIMDVDPLADRAPPRHAIESDSEDEPDAALYPPNSVKSSESEKRKPEAEKSTSIVWTQTSHTGKTSEKLIIALEQISAALTETFDFDGWEEIAKVNHGDEEVRPAYNRNRLLTRKMLIALILPDRTNHLSRGNNLNPSP
jgi:hypothetical protein